MGDLWHSAKRRVAARNTPLSIVAAGDCPGRSLDRYIGPLLEAAGPLRGRFIDVCGWDGSTCDAHPWRSGSWGPASSACCWCGER